MKKFPILALLLGMALSGFAQQQLLKPNEFLGYELGERFTRHHRVVEYFQHVASVVPNVELYKYGETYEYRPLVYAVVTSPENLKNLEQIRLDNLRRTGLESGTPSTKIPIVWLSYNVHGNEASSIEASMQTLYELANPANGTSANWLKNTVVIIDPCINPDGRDRYANFYNSFGNRPANASPDAREHREYWPGGRSNHYWFDLNRDWAWLTQIESQQRIKVYNQWMPHVHVDFHEQGYNNPYYFAPAAEPYHEVITPWQREFQVMIGKNHAKYFDKQGWLYFTKEVFDLYYPSYGDTYPTYNGAIGMTYEQAGGGFAGLSITTREGDPLTLKDRWMHHHTTGMSTVEITAVNAQRVLDEFEKYFRENNNSPASPYKTYVIKGDNQPDKIQRLTKLMDAHGVKYGHLSAGKSTRGFDYSTQTTQAVNLSSDDIIISVYQPKSRFITTLFEPQSKLPDSVTYDITAWNLMYAYGLKGFALNERINVGKTYQPKEVVQTPVSGKPYAYVFRYQSLSDVKFLGALLNNDVTVRAAMKPFKVNGESFDAGSLIVTQRNNESIPDFDQFIQSLAREHNRKWFAATTGFVDSGKDFGSGYVNYIKAPKIAALVGDQTSSLSAGATWHFFEQELQYPITQIGTDYFRSVDLGNYDVLLVPEGRYRMFDEETMKSVQEWVSNGGRLILVSGALNAFADKNGFALKKFSTEEAKKEAEKKDKEDQAKDVLLPYDAAERNAISQTISGAIYKVTLDKSHPLAFGLGDAYYTLKTNELYYSYLQQGWNVGVIKGKAKPVQGFAGYKINKKLDNSFVFGVEEKGRGTIVYFVDDPLFRNFWESGKMLFSNAVFMVGQ
ncbi:MAG: M14 family metallopeptidase [Cyclobacteriaceae bacterium]|nr:MAG: M14 family metallopeptidase [Cyclobacteriaceae bacterium]